MSLLRVAELRAPEGASSGAAWLPSHVQVTVVEARGLRAKAGPGAGDAFVALQLGRQKHRTAVATQKGGGSPRWAEQCAFELPPPPPAAPGPRDPPEEAPPPLLLLQLTVWQRALVGADRFLGRAALPLDALLEGGRAHPDRWYKLHSKPGKKEKDRGEIKVGLQFTRHSLTASMFDLSVKEKPRSPFRKLKDKVKGRQKYDLESASAIVPSSSGGLDPDGGDEDEEGGGSGFGLVGRKGKAKGSSGGGFFFRSKLRKSSLSQSNTSLGSDSTVSSAGSLVGLSLPERMSQSPSRHSSLSTDPSGGDVLPSPKLTHKRAFSDEVSQINVLPESPSAQSLKPLREPISRSSLCINGSHIYCEEPSPKPSFLSSAPPLSPLPPPQSIAPKLEERPLAGQPLESDLPPWPGSSSSSSSSSRFPKAPPNDPPRFIPSPPILAAQEEDKLSVKTIALNKHRGRVKMEESLRAESKPVQIAVPVAFSSEVVRVRPQEEAPKGEEEEEEDEKKKKKATSGFFRRGSGKDSRRKSSPAEGAETSPRPVAAKTGRGAGSSGGWFGRQDSKEPPQKPSSPPGLLATTDFAARDPSCSEDGGPSPSGQSRTEAAPPGQSDRELPLLPPSAAQPPSEWDDSFDAFATSRLRPGPGGGPPVSPSGTRGPSEAESPEEREGGTHSRCSGTAGDELTFGAPELPSLAPEERGAEGNQAPREPLESTPGETPLPWGMACEEELGPGDPAGEHWPQEERAGEDLEGEARSTWKAERRRSSERMSAVVLGQALERDGGGRPPAASSAAALATSFPPSAVLFQEEGEASLAGGLEPTPPAILSLLRGRSQSASEADRGAPPLAGLRPGGVEAGEVGALSPGPSVPAIQVTRGAAELPGEVHLEVSREEEEEEGDAIQGVQEQGEAGEPKAGTPPPKPPRSFTPLSLEEEASPALCDSRPEPWPGRAAPRDLWGDWEVDVPPAHPPAGEDAGAPLASAPPLAPTAMAGGGGAGAGSGQGATEAAAQGSDAAEAQEWSRPASSSRGTVPAVGEGPGRAERFEMFPPELSVEGPSLTDGRGETALLGGQEPGSSLWTTELVRLPELGSFQTAKELPRQDGGSGAGPPRTPQAPCSSPSVLFWTALEEQQLPTPLDHPAAEPPGGRGEEEGQPPALGPGEGAPASCPIGEAPPPPSPPYPELLVGEMLKPGPEGGSASELGLSSSWPGERMMDFKKADFWQAERGGQSSPCDSPALTPGNPFAPWAGPPPPPSPQNNPFVGRPPDVLPSGAAVLRGSPAERGSSFGGLQAEAAPQGLFLAHPSEEQPPARAPLRGHPPLAFSTPALQAALRPKDFSFPSPVGRLGAGGGPAAQTSLALAQPGTDTSAPPVLPAETQQAEEVSRQQTASPHPVKPISSTPRPELEEEEERKRRAVSLTPIRSAPQEKRKPGSGSVDSSSLTLQLEKAETKRDPSALDPSAKYYHLTHDELIQLLLKREAELGKRQDRILELESYIDRLLVRIMEHSPTLLQIPLGGEAEATE